jgi:hypothetical protein
MTIISVFQRIIYSTDSWIAKLAAATNMVFIKDWKTIYAVAEVLEARFLKVG